MSRRSTPMRRPSSARSPGLKPPRRVPPRPCLLLIPFVFILVVPALLARGHLEYTLPYAPLRRTAAPLFAGANFTDRATQYDALAKYFLKHISPGMLQPQVLRAAYDGNLNSLEQVAYYIRIVDGVVRYKGSYVNGRVTSMLALIRRVMDTYDHVPNCEFIVVLNDGTRPAVPVMGVARHWKSWTRLVPIPLLNENSKEKEHKSGYARWDSYIRESVATPSEDYKWADKIPRAFFRGSFVMQTWALGSLNNFGKGVRPTSWREVNRGRLVTVAQQRPDLFDVGLTMRKGSPKSLSRTEFDSIPVVSTIASRDWMKWKALITVGSNQDWTERLRALLFTNSVVLLHQAESVEWFYPLLRAFEHFVPFNVMMDDLIDNAEWALDSRNDDAVSRIVVNANKFATTHLTEEAMAAYFYAVLTNYASLQHQSVESLDVFAEPDEESDNPYRTLDEAHDRASVEEDFGLENSAHEPVHFDLKGFGSDE